jgi:predicted ribosome quality control (RQC) complex YloA/Tae2 family protein
MATGLRFDTLLVRALARSLHERWSNVRLTAVGLDPEGRSALLESKERTLLLDLHPARGFIVEATPRPLPVRVKVGQRVAAVSAPPDERILRFAISGGGEVVVELLANQWNALLVGRDGRIAAVLRPGRGGGRELRKGQLYRPPPPTERLWAAAPPSLEEWLGALAAAPADELERRYTTRVAYASPLNAAWVLGAPSPAESHSRYVALREAAGAYLVGGGQPYPAPLGDDTATPFPDLLAAFARAAGLAPDTAAEAAVSPELLRRLERRVATALRKEDRLREEAAGSAAEAARLRTTADVLLAQLHAVPRGAARVRLTDFAGAEVEVELDPARSAADNVAALYDAARRRDRAAARVPELLARAAAERASLAALLARARAGSALAAEVEAALGPGADRRGRPSDEPLLPYRRYRTSGGLEVRVGRNRAANDDLTFHHSSPNDVWLHARDVGGSHVVLRWSAPDNPPARDLEEAAVLAALHSKARTSGVVPVDWTRRKHVRKPRKAPPGRVVVERVKTVFVEPSAEVEERLRV